MLSECSDNLCLVSFIRDVFHKYVIMNKAVKKKKMKRRG